MGLPGQDSFSIKVLRTPGDRWSTDISTPISERFLWTTYLEYRLLRFGVLKASTIIL